MWSRPTLQDERSKCTDVELNLQGLTLPLQVNPGEFRFPCNKGATERETTVQIKSQSFGTIPVVYVEPFSLCLSKKVEHFDTEMYHVCIQAKPFSSKYF